MIKTKLVKTVHPTKTIDILFYYSYSYENTQIGREDG